MLKSKNNWKRFSVERNNHEPRKITQADVGQDVLWWARRKIHSGFTHLYDLHRKHDFLVILIWRIQPTQKLNTKFQEHTNISHVTDFSRISHAKRPYVLYRSSNSRQTVSRLPAKCIGPLQLLPLYRLPTNHTNQHSIAVDVTNYCSCYKKQRKDSLVRHYSKPFHRWRFTAPHTYTIWADIHSLCDDDTFSSKW